MSTFGFERQNRGHQVNVRLDSIQAARFKYILEQMHHQTLSDGIRDLLRTGYIELDSRGENEISRMLENIPKAQSIDSKGFQLNVRLTDDEIGMTTKLLAKMRVKSVSRVLRNLIDIYYVSLAQREQQAS